MEEYKRGKTDCTSPGERRSRQCEVLLYFSDFLTNRDLAFARYNLRDDESPDTNDSLVCCNCKIRQD